MITQYAGKTALILGVARSGIAAAKLLTAHGGIPWLYDAKKISDLSIAEEDRTNPSFCWHLGENPIELVDSVDFLIISPAFRMDAPAIVRAIALCKPVIGELEFAFSLAPCPVYAITGTNGKTTTVSLLGDMFAKAGKNTFVAGNIGYPLSAAVLQAESDDVLIAEVSSFQLESIETFAPKAAAVLNVTPDHLDRHGTLACYAAMKRKVFINQQSDDIAVLNADDAYCKGMAEGLASQIAWFSRASEIKRGAFVRNGQLIVRWNDEEKAVCDVEEIRLPGAHNLENALAAALIAFIAGVPPAVIRHALKTFSGVEHRIEFVAAPGEVRYYNDSKGTNPDSTIKAVEAMKAPTVLIMGGYDKRVPFDQLADVIVKSGLIRACVLMGQTREIIKDSLLKAGFTSVREAKSLEEAVEISADIALPGWNVLFSPACSSFDMFHDYEERGRMFKSIVLEKAK